MAARNRSYSETFQALSLMHDNQKQTESTSTVDEDGSPTPDGDLLLESGTIIHTSPKGKDAKHIDRLSVECGKIELEKVTNPCTPVRKSIRFIGSESGDKPPAISSPYNPAAPVFVPLGPKHYQHGPGFRTRGTSRPPGPTPPPTPRYQGMFRNRPPYSHTLCKKSAHKDCAYGPSCRFGHDGDRYFDSPHVTQRFFGTQHAEQWEEPDGKGGLVTAFGTMEEGIRRRRALNIAQPVPRGGRGRVGGSHTRRLPPAAFDTPTPAYRKPGRARYGVGNAFSPRSAQLFSPVTPPQACGHGYPQGLGNVYTPPPSHGFRTPAQPSPYTYPAGFAAGYNPATPYSPFSPVATPPCFCLPAFPYNQMSHGWDCNAPPPQPRFGKNAQTGGAAAFRP